MQKTLLCTLIGGALLIAPSVRAQMLKKQEGKVFGIEKVLKATTPIKTLGAAPFAATPVAKAAQRSEAAITPDWSSDMSAEEFAKFTVIDANNDATDNGTFKSETWTNNGSKTFLYASANAADDWFIAPAFNLKGGRSYKVAITTNCFTATHKLEIKWGNAATVDGMTETALEATAVPKGDAIIDATITPTADGVYYIGLHGLSAAYSFNLYIKKFEVTAIASATVPSEVTNITITPDSNAELKASITFTPPTTKADGTPLDNLEGVKVLRNGTQIADLTDVKAGKPYTYEDKTVEKAAMQTYSFVAYNSDGDSEAATAERWVGLDVPGVTSRPWLSATDDDKIKVSWEPFGAANNGVIFPADITYNIYDIVEEGGTAYRGDKDGSVKGDTEFVTATPTETGEQRYAYKALQGENASGASKYIMTSPILVGKPYSLPIREDFENGTLQHFWASEQTGNGEYLEPSAGIFSNGGTDADGNGVFITMRTMMNDIVTLCSGKINLAGMENPTLAFKFKSETNAGKFKPFVQTKDGLRIFLEETDLATATSQWTLKKYSLNDYTNDKWIQVGFTMSDPDGASQQEVYIDDINIDDLKPVDLAITLDNIPESIEKGKTVYTKIKIRNYGSTSVKAYDIRITANGKVINEQTVRRKLDAFGHHEYDIPYSPAITELADKAEIKAEVKHADDAVADNNTATATFALTVPDLEPATALAVTETAASHNLAWTAPPATLIKTEGFETATAWATDNIGKWTMIDGDRGDCYGLLDDLYLYYDSEGGPFAFTVFNSYNYGGYDLNKAIPSFNVAPKNGKQTLAAFYSTRLDTETYIADVIDADNWLISPELTGKAQEISFWANNFNDTGTNSDDEPYSYDYPETFEVLYSTNGTNILNFTKIGDTYNKEGGKWQEYKVQLPEGAKYFAIHHNSKKRLDDEDYIMSPWLFQLDDITYATTNLKVLSYNVYRDGELIGNTSSTTYVDNSATTGNHVYQVTTVYEGNLESAPVTHGAPTGIDTLPTAENAANAVVGIYTIDGKKVQTLAKGINIVKMKNGSARKIVK